MSKARKQAKDLPIERYVNRELSWLKFNERVLEEACRERNPILEKLKFLAIFESNLDEFYMVRVSGLIEQYESGTAELSIDGLTPTAQLDKVAEIARPMRRKAGKIFQEQLKPELERAGIELLSYDELSDKQRSDVEKRFQNEIFPLCTPLMLHPAPSVPFISNRSLNLAVQLRDDAGNLKVARVKIPTVIPRAIRVAPRRFEFVLLEEVIQRNLHLLFPGVMIEGSYLFRVLRDADVEIRQLEAEDLIETIENTLRLRRFGDPVLLEADQQMPNEIREILMRLLKLEESDVFDVEGLIGLDVLMELAKIDKPSLRFATHVPRTQPELQIESDLLKIIRDHDLLLHHPFDSFHPVEKFISLSAADPKVIGIKQTLYRVGTKSPIVESLLDAAEEGKQVAAMVELKARFDESNNLGWARALERSGAHVTYGFPELKTHCKLSMLVREDADGIRTYVHVGTGNYNPSTARLYTDLGLLTCDPEICQDVTELFNYLTGFSKQSSYRKLLVAPINLRERIREMIHREIQHQKKSGVGRMIFKLNSLVDPEMIDLLYEASGAGVKIDLIIRGICGLRAGVAGLSENIRVVSIIGRFLEHSRIYYFGNAGKPEVYFGSADLMRRNLDRRIEVLAPLEDKQMISYVRDVILEAYLRDTENAWLLTPDGNYVKLTSPDAKKSFDAHQFLMKGGNKRALNP